jgi:hypothetical protein
MKRACSVFSTLQKRTKMLKTYKWEKIRQNLFPCVWFIHSPTTTFKGRSQAGPLFFGRPFFEIIGPFCGEFEMSHYLDVLPLLQEYDAIGMRPKHICGLVGISETAMSRAKNGSEDLPPQDFVNVRDLLPECQELARRNILPVDWSDLRPIRRQLELLRNEKRNPPSEPSAGDLDIFRRFVAGEDPHSIALAHKISDAEVLPRKCCVVSNR